MKVHHDIHLFSAVNPAVTIGNFDGIHLAHKAIIERVKELATEHNGESVLVTLWPHPRLVLQHAPHELRFLTLLEEKIELIRQSGIDHLVILPFTREFAQVTYKEFITDYLLRQIKAQHIVVGFNHHFGKNREGTFGSLKKLADQMGFYAEQYPPLLVEGMQVSASEIRKLLMQGKVKKANLLLGYLYLITGKVTEGKRLGREMGFPTANVVVSNDNKLIPADGVYAVNVVFENKQHQGMMNIGTKPTVNELPDKKTIEVHLFEFGGNLYNKDITINFVDRIRDEKRFQSLEELRLQLVADKEASLRIFQNTNE
ncbi:MAG: bifunctional riboflavin kinase/FAD synthetase [Bacteroidota bacterium]